jgi:hypothetical protein
MTQIDITAPHQVFSFLPNTTVHFLWKTPEPVTSDKGLTLLPNTTFEQCPPLDVLCVPGGPGQVEMMQDEIVLEFLREQSQTAWIEEVLVEDQNPKDPTQVMGRTRGNRLTFFTGDINQLKGQLVKVKITEVRAFSLTGERVDAPALVSR